MDSPDLFKVFDRLYDLAVLKAKAKAKAKVKAKARVAKPKAKPVKVAKPAAKAPKKVVKKPLAKKPVRTAAKPAPKAAAKPAASPAAPAAAAAGRKDRIVRIDPPDPMGQSGRKRDSYRVKTAGGKTRYVESLPKGAGPGSIIDLDTGEVSTPKNPADAHAHGIYSAVNSMAERLAKAKKDDMPKVFHGALSSMKKAHAELMKLGDAGKEKWEEMQKRVRARMTSLMQAHDLIGKGKHGAVDPKVLKDFEKMMSMFGEGKEAPKTPEEKENAEKKVKEIQEKIKKEMENPGSGGGIDNVVGEGVAALLLAGTVLGGAFLALSIPLLLTMAVGVIF